MHNGQFHYDLSRDMSDGARFKKTTARMSNAQRLDPAIEGSPVTLNLELAESNIKSVPVNRRGLIAVARDVNREIRKTLGDRVKLRLGAKAFYFGDGYNNLDGYFINGTIGVALDANDPVGVARHEVIHALRDPKVFGGTHGAFTKAEWQTLVRTARKAKAIFGVGNTHRTAPDLQGRLDGPGRDAPDELGRPRAQGVDAGQPPDRQSRMAQSI